MLRKIALTAAAFAGAASTAPADAAIITMTFYGNATTVYSYGPYDQLLNTYTNVPYMSVYTIDDSLGTEYKSSYESYFEGPGVTAVVTLTGIGSYTLDGSGNHRIDVRNDQSGIGDSINASAGTSINQFSSTTQTYVSAVTHDDFIAPTGGPYTTTDFRQPLDYTMQASDAVSSSFAYQAQQYNFTTSTFLSYEKISAFVTLNRVVVAAAGVPENGTWAMLITGVGMVGWAMRRKRSAALAPRMA